jgi:uroporphyrinogen-III decarboxylase
VLALAPHDVERYCHLTMSPMTNRERILGVLRGEEVDRVPIWLLFPWDRITYYTDVRREPSFAPVVEAMTRTASVLNRRTFDIDVFSTDFRRAFAGKSFASSLPRALSTQEVTASGSTPLTAAGRFLDSVEDLETFMSLPINDSAGSVGRLLEVFLPAYQSESRCFPIDMGAMMLDLGEPVGVLYAAANLLEYPVWSLSHRAQISAFLRRLQSHFLEKYRWCLERDLADIYFLVGSELAAPPMVGPETFREWVLPFQKELIDLVHSFGKLVITHFHGRIRDRLEDFIGLAPDGLHTIEEPPIGDCPLADALRIVDDRMALIGTVQYDNFLALDAEAMRAEVRRILREANGRRFVLSPTAGPFHPTLNDRMRDNYLAFMDEGDRAGGSIARHHA